MKFTVQKFFSVLAGMILIFSACTNTPKHIGNGGLSIIIEPGEHFTHPIPIILWFTIQAPPQAAVWVEDADGRVVQTLFVTAKTATGKWIKAPEDTGDSAIARPESLPVWTHRTRMNEIDAVTNASSASGYVINSSTILPGMTIYAEINASLDFNEYYPVTAEPGDANFSGGDWGSGQPSLIYSATLPEDAQEIELHLTGSGSPDGSDGDIHEISGITTADRIVSSILLRRNPAPYR